MGAATRSEELETGERGSVDPADLLSSATALFNYRLGYDPIARPQEDQ
jgi:hypothetical protein